MNLIQRNTHTAYNLSKLIRKQLLNHIYFGLILRLSDLWVRDFSFFFIIKNKNFYLLPHRSMKWHLCDTNPIVNSATDILKYMHRCLELNVIYTCTTTNIVIIWKCILILVLVFFNEHTEITVKNVSRHEKPSIEQVKLSRVWRYCVCFISIRNIIYSTTSTGKVMTVVLV